MMSLFAQMGFDSVFFARIDYADYALRSSQQRLEWLWKPSQSLNVSIFTHSMFHATYCPPGGFAWDYGDDPINDDPNLENVNVARFADMFASDVKSRTKGYRTNQILWAFGCDFQYSNPRLNFKSMNKLFRYMNARQDKYGMELVYSTPSRYVKAVNAAGITDWEVKTDDIFPYADSPHSYWTGYMTSRPAIKSYVRSRGAFLRAADKMAVSAGVGTTVEAADVLRRAYSQATHHDAIAGTEKQHVAYDYAKVMANGTAAVEAALVPVLQALTSIQSSWSFCEYLNETICPQITDALSKGQKVRISLWNSLAWDRTEVVTLPAVAGTTVSLNNSVIPSQLSVDPDTGRTSIAFVASVPALGWTLVSLVPPASREVVRRPSSSSSFSRSIRGVRGDWISNEAYNLTFGGPGGALSSINGFPVTMDYLWYNASTGNNKLSDQASGAYIFRPNASTPFAVAAPGTDFKLVIEKGPVYQAARLTYSNWVTVIIRLYLGFPEYGIDFETRLGAIPIADGMGKEVIHRFQTSIKSGDTWYTDAGWEELQLRRRDYRPTWKLNTTEPVSENYFPINLAGMISDSKLQATILTDRSRGFSSLASGQFESMIHRRLLADDRRGVGEPLNESAPILMHERLLYATPGYDFRQPAMRFNHPLAVAIAVTTQNGPVASLRAGLTQALPSAVHLMDYFFLDSSTSVALVRFRHLYALSDGVAPVTFTFQQYVPRTIKSMVETQLTGVESATTTEQRRLRWNGDARRHPLQHDDDGDTSVSLSPMQIRTYIVTFS